MNLSLTTKKTRAPLAVRLAASRPTVRQGSSHAVAGVSVRRPRARPWVAVGSTRASARKIR